MPAPATSPLVLALRSTLIALDAETGAHHWHVSMPMQIRRVFPLDGALLVVLAQAADATKPAGAGAIVRVELASGMVLRRLELAFDPSGAALRDGDRIVVASEHGVACVTTDCQLVWSGGVRDEQRGLFGSDKALVVLGADGKERAHVVVGATTSCGNAGLVLRDLVAQPDLRD